jgi:hypothetical protein
MFTVLVVLCYVLEPWQFRQLWFPAFAAEIRFFS